MGSLAHRYEKQNVLLFVSKPINYTPASVQTAVQTVNSLLQLPVTIRKYLFSNVCLGS